MLTHERRAIQLRITFSWVRKGGKEREGRRQHDGDQLEGGIMIVPRRDHHEMQQGMGCQETCAGNRRGPIPGPPESGKKIGPFVVLKCRKLALGKPEKSR